MVHALSEAGRVLRPGGLLIDLRPTARNRRVELELAEARLHIGEIDSSNSAAEKRMADEALQATLERGLFRAEHQARFEFVTDLDTLEDLREFGTRLRRSVMPEGLPRRIAALTAGGGEDYLIRIRREMIIWRLRRLPVG